MKIVFIDADGTLCHLKYGISEKNRKSIQKLRDNNYQVVLCTSRSMPFVTKDIRSLNFDGYITSGGACITDNKKLSQFVIPHDVVIKIVSRLACYDLAIILCGENQILYDTKQLNTDYDPWFNYINEKIQDVYAPISSIEANANISKICIKIKRGSFPKTELDMIIEKIKCDFYVDVIEGRDDCNEIVEYEILYRGCSKGFAIKKYLEMFTEKNEIIESWAIGDGFVDISMFKNVDVSIAMGNASDIVKNSALYTTESFMNDGLSYACENIILKKEVYERLLSITDISTDGILGYERFLIFDKAQWLDNFIMGNAFPPIQIDWQVSSKCNLQCRWCVGRNLKEENQMVILRDNMSYENVRNLATKIVELNINGMKVDTVQFSGFTGEPLIQWNELCKAIMILKEGGIRIGIFTNGTLMGSNTWDVLTDIESVHVSIDGGKESWKLIKSPKSQQFSFQELLDNTAGLVKKRNEKGSNTEINTGFTVAKENIMELESVIGSLADIGVDSICIKYDITGKEKLPNFENVKKLIASYKEKYENDKFKILLMHDIQPQKDDERWNCLKGCYYRYFFCTVGSDGNIYPCDYQTLQERPSFGNVYNLSLHDVIELKNKNWESAMIKSNLFNNVCPPLAEVINPYLDKLCCLIQKYGKDVVMNAIIQLRKDYR